MPPRDPDRRTGPATPPTQRNRIASPVLAALLASLSIAVGQSSATDMVSRDPAVLTLPTPAKLAIWTDKPGYLRARDDVRAYLTVDPKGDARPLRTFIYLENIKTGWRRYLVRESLRYVLTEEVVDVRDVGLRVADGAPLSYLPPTRIWFQSMLEAGLWQFVVELRSADTTEIVKRAHAKFVVSARIPIVVGGRGRDTEISTDTIWTNDTIHALQGQVFVNPGATLTIEPGTLVLGRQPGAAIVIERGGRIVARGRPEAPIVMTCDEPVGQRFAGCWAGLRVLGNAPVAGGENLAEGIVPETRARYGGYDPLDSSGLLQYVRVEFAGAGTPAAAGPAGLGFYGVGSGTRIDHVQARASAGDGILFSGGTANCMYCVSSGSTDDELAWALGWRGTAQHMFLQQGSAGGDHAIEGANDEFGFGTAPRSAPRLYNLTLVGDPSRAPWPQSRGGGILLRDGSAVTVRNALVTGFSSGAIDVRDHARTLFIQGVSSIDNAILSAGAGGTAHGQVNGGIEAIVGFLHEDARLVNARYQANPDPRPTLGSPALRVGTGAAPPSDGLLDTSAQYVGAFGDSNWLEEWTFFGAEADYDMRALEGNDD